MKVLSKAKKIYKKGRGVNYIEPEGNTKIYHIIHIYEFKKKTPNVILQSFFKSQLDFVKKVIKETGNKAFATLEGKTITFEEYAELDEKALTIRMEEPRFFAGVSKHIIDTSTIKSKTKKVIAKALKPQALAVRKGLGKMFTFHYKLYEVRENGEERLIEEA